MANPLSVIKALEGASEAVGAAKKGIRAYHGSPYKFDKFDASKIGTGEGAQAYGHGLYFAENENTAQAYRDALKRMNDEITFDGTALKGPSDFSKLQYQLEDQDWRQWKAVDEITKRQGEITERLKDIRNWYRNQPEMLSAIDKVQTRMGLNANPGYMYEVNIGADPSHFLDWDKPLSEQPQTVKELIRDELKAQKYLGPNDNGPRQLQSAIRSWKMAHGSMLDTPLQSILTGRRNIAGGTSAEVANKLNSAGIPGVKYLDQGSRSAKRGTRNYVVFNPDIIEILRRYNRGGFAVKR
jgi:hypothetical protein